jgi:CheY-like chemotaxis protein
VLVRAEASIEKGRSAVRFSVTDTGPGIAEEDLGKLFEAFRQGDGSMRRRHGGTGLGLSISKRLVDMMDGEIGVESSFGAGSTFWFWLPFARAADEIPAQPVRSLRGKRVLIFEDDDSSRAVVEQYLLAWGLVATSAGNAAQAIALMTAAAARDAPFDVALLDDRGPGIDGFSLAARIRSEAAIAKTPLVLVSARSEMGLASEATARGFAGSVRKPIKQSALYEAIAFAVDGTRPVPAPAPAGGTVLRDDVLVLIAEDNPVNRKLALTQLKKLGYRANAVENGAEAVRAVAATAYDLVLMDCQMPELDGFDAARTIRRAEEQTGARVPIVAMTANALEGDREACLAAGMDDYLAKPVQLAELRAVLERFTARGMHAG